MKDSVKAIYPDCAVSAIPIADGGEGTADTFLYALGAEKVTVAAPGPYLDRVPAYYARIDRTAIIETASVAGLPMVEGRMNPCKTTTYGLGVLIHHAIESGCTNIVLGLGGSCTNDAGIGMARALGTVFLDRNGREFIPDADQITEISAMDISATEELMEQVTVTAMCDIDNPLYGEKGAAYVFAPQKGADAEMVKLLDDNLKAFAQLAKNCRGRDISELPGAGAAGGLGAGTVVFLKAELKSGIETILELVHFDELLQDTDMVFTGEGKIDHQSLRGKAVIGIARHAAKKQVPVTAVVGSIGEGAEEAYELGVSSIFSINRSPMEFEQSKSFSDINLRKTMDSIIRFYKSAVKQ
jgi:glycerate kinase